MTDQEFRLMAGLVSEAIRWEAKYERMHSEEFAALVDAKEGRPERLAQLAETKGLATPEAKAYSASLIRGDRKKRGKKRTNAQVAKEMLTFCNVMVIQAREGLSREKAILTYCAQHESEDVPEETIRTLVRRGEKEFYNLVRAYFARHMQRVQNSQNSEPSQAN
jgi:hypothetical protein